MVIGSLFSFFASGENDIALLEIITLLPSRGYSFLPLTHPEFIGNHDLSRG
jgi:hypothetical protein